MKARTQLLREPLLHFLVIGAALFGVYAWLNRDNNDTAPQVHLADSDVRWLKDTFVLQWQRQPTDEELRGLIRGFVKEELFARQAQELGLDKDDIVVRRRLAQKMTFLLQDASSRKAPSDDDLRRVYEALRAPTGADAAKLGETQTLYTRRKISFTQVFFSRDKRADPASEARAALPELLRANATVPPNDMGDQASVRSEFRNVDERAVSNQFGGKFAAKVFDLPVGPWQGPIESNQGVHLVRVTALLPGELRPFEQVREQLVELWHEQQQRASEERYFGELLKKYRVVPDESVKALLGPALADTGDGTAPRGSTP
jgi:hypothetical protein